MELVNRTELDFDRLRRMLDREIDGWPHERVHATVRYSRGADFSGTCYDRKGTIYVNVGRHVVYPYAMRTHIARAKSNATHWWKELYTVRIADAYQLALFVFLHEFYHWLVRQAKRNPRQKESMCDRFATRALVMRYGALVHDTAGAAVGRSAWDFQDVDGFVGAARRRMQPRRRIGA
jgi:hypothetical protein